MSTVTSSSSTDSAANKNPKNMFPDVTSKVANLDFDDYTNSSILEFLNKEQECFYGSSRDTSEINDEIIFEEVNRLSDNTDTRTVDEILREAELLINKRLMVGASPAANGTNGGFEAYKSSNLTNCRESSCSAVVSVEKGRSSPPQIVNSFEKVVDNVHLDSVISDESTPKDMRNFTANNAETDDIDEDTTDTVSFSD